MKMSLVMAVLLAAFLTSGCATLSVIDNANDLDKNTNLDKDMNFVTSVSKAYRDDAGNVTVCVAGKLKNANRKSASGDLRGDYSFRFPAASTPKLDSTTFNAITRYQLTATDINEYCPDPINGMTPLPIHTVAYSDTEVEKSRVRGEKPIRGTAGSGPGGRFSNMSDEELTMFFENRADGPTIYSFYYTPKSYSYDTRQLKTIVYLHDSPDFDGKWAVEIGTGQLPSKTKPAPTVLLPVAVAFDIVTFPVQLLVGLYIMVGMSIAQ